MKRKELEIAVQKEMDILYDSNNRLNDEKLYQFERAMLNGVIPVDSELYSKYTLKQLTTMNIKNAMLF